MTRAINEASINQNAIVQKQALPILFCPAGCGHAADLRCYSWCWSNRFRIVFVGSVGISFAGAIIFAGTVSCD